MDGIGSEDAPSQESVHEALELVGQLALRADTHLAAAMAGGPQFIGWTTDRYLWAETRDLITGLILALAGKGMSPDDLWPRPKVQEEPQEAATIADFSVEHFTRWLYS